MKYEQTCHNNTDIAEHMIENLKMEELEQAMSSPENEKITRERWNYK